MRIKDRIELSELKSCDVDRAISLLQKTKTELRRRGCEDITLDIDADKAYDDYGDSSYIETHVYMTGYREETPEELAKRESEAAARAKLAADRELREYERLKKQFEKK